MFNHKMKLLTAIVFSLAIFASFSHAQVCTTPPSGLVAWYPANGNANDISGNGNHGTLQNGATFAAGQVGQAFELDGVNDDVTAADSPSLNFGTGSFSVETWVRAESFPGDYAGVVAKGIPPGTNRWFLFRGPSPFVVGAFPWRVILNSGSTTINAVSDSNALTGQWTHLAFVVDRTSATLKFYVNGVLQSSQPNIGALGSLDSTLPLRIGNDNEGSFFDGQTDETSIYNRALSTSEIQAIFNAGSAGKCQTVTAASVSVSGRVLSPKGRGVSRATVSLTDPFGDMRSVLTNHFGYFRFEDIEAGQTYVFSVFSKGYQFTPQVVTVNEDITDLHFTAQGIQFKVF